MLHIIISGQWRQWYGSLLELLPMKLVQLFELFIKLITDAMKDILRQIKKIWEDVEDAVIYAFETVRDFILGIGETIWKEAQKNH